MAERIPGARFVELPGDFHISGRVGDDDDLLDVVEEFVTGVATMREPDVDRVLATVLFTDIVDSTACASRLGDRAWTSILRQHDEIASREIVRHRGIVVKRTGDGLLATFDGPGRCVRAAQTIRGAMRPLGLDLRAGIHTGEIQRSRDDVAGIAVHIGARIGELAGGGEVLVSSTVKDLVTGSGIDFADRGRHQLKGLPGDWQIWAAVG
jgi:class 3 adenylate cyclase